MKKSNNEWNLVQIIAVWAISFLSVQIFSFFTWGLFFDIEGDGNPSDGFTLFFVLFVVNPVWLILAISLPVIARRLFKGKYADLNRVLFCGFVPVIVAVAITAAMTTALFN